MAMAYVREGADVAIVARTDSELDAAASEIRALGRRAHTVNAELTTSDGANRAARETIGELGKIDILVNNVGGYRLFTNDLTHSVTVLDVTEEEWRLVMESNLTKPNDDYDDEVHKRMRLPDDIAEVAVYMALQTPETMTGQLVSAAEYDEEHGIKRLSAYDRLHAQKPLR